MLYIALLFCEKNSCAFLFTPPLPVLCRPPKALFIPLYVRARVVLLSDPVAVDFQFRVLFAANLCT